MAHPICRGVGGAAMWLSLLVVLAVCAMAPKADARAQAPGAPGDPHTWAPADKHGFGTATDARQQRLVHAARRGAERGLLPGPRHPEPARARVRGHRRAHLPRPRDRRRGRGAGAAGAGLADLPPDHRDAPLAADQDLDRRPAGRQRARRRALRLAAPAGRWRSTRSPTRRPATTATTTAARRLGDGLLAHDDTVASLIAARPALAQQTSGYAGTASDPWRDLRDDSDLDRLVHAPADPATSCRRRAPGSPASAATAGMTLAIGFGASTGRGRRRRAGGSLARGFARAAQRYAAGWQDYLDSLSEPPESVAGDPQLLAPLRPVADGARGLGGQAPPRRRRRLADDALGLGHADARGPRGLRARTTSSGRATSTTSRSRRRPPATTRPPGGSSTSCGGCRSPTARGGRTPRSTAPCAGTTPSSTRSRCRSCSPGSSGAPGPPTGSTCAAAADYVVANGPETPAGALGEPGRLVAEHDRDRDRGADLRRRHRPRQRRRRRARRPTRRRPTAGSAGSRAGPRPTTAPTTGRGPTTCGSPRTATPTTAAPTRSATTSRARSTSARWSTRASSGWSCSASSPTTTRPCSTRSRSATGCSRSRPRTGPSGTASPSTATARRATAASGTSSTTPQRQTLGRAWPLLTGERGEYELLAGGDAAPAPGDDRRHRQRRPDAARAGLGRAPADRDRPATSSARARARRRRWPGPTPSSSASPGRSTRASRSSGRRSSPAATRRGLLTRLA